MVLHADGHFDWRNLLTPGQAAGVHGKSLRIEGHPPIDFSRAELWSPPVFPWDCGSVRAGLDELDKLLTVLPTPKDGLGCFARPDGRADTAAEAPVRDLAIWLTAKETGAPSLDGLLGNGRIAPAFDDRGDQRRVP